MVQKKTCGVILTKCGKHIENEMALEMEVQNRNECNLGSLQSLDWTGGLDWWTRQK